MSICIKDQIQNMNIVIGCTGLELAAKASAIAVSRPGATASIPLRSEVVKEKSNGKI